MNIILRNRDKEKAKRLAYKFGLMHVNTALKKAIHKRSFIIFMYHRVNTSNAPFFEKAVTPDIFDRQCKFFKKNYQIIDFADLEIIQNEKKLKKPLIIITFDDGYLDNYEFAYPILKKYQLPATIFLTVNYVGTDKLLWYDKLAWTLYKSQSYVSHKSLLDNGFKRTLAGLIANFKNSNAKTKQQILNTLAMDLKKHEDQDRRKIIKKLEILYGKNENPGERERAMLSWEEVKEMSLNGVTFGSHTLNHPFLKRIKPKDAKDEIEKSKLIIENIIQKDVISFAFPYGKDEDFNENNLEVIKKANYKYACTTTRGRERLPIEDRFRLKRRGVPNSSYLFI